MDLEPVAMQQIVIHFIHRIWAFVILGFAGLLTFIAVKTRASSLRLIFAIDFLLLVQITLGMFTIWSAKQYVIASMHVLIGASLLGLSAYLALQNLPLTLKNGVPVTYEK